MRNVEEKIVDIIKDNFPNGLRADFIDTNRILRIYSADHAAENISRNFIVNIIRAKGIEAGGRFYFISKGDLATIRRLFDDISQRCTVVYYSTVYERHRDFFASMHVFSPDLLKQILREADVARFYLDEFCSASSMTRLEYEISKIFMSAKTSLSLEDLQKKLPYVPPKKIFLTLSNSKKFLKTNSGKFIPLSKIRFDSDEIRTAASQISSCIDSNGFANPEDYTLSENFALNPEIAEKDLRTAIYEEFFASTFIKRGKKLFRKGAAVKDECLPAPSSTLRKFIDKQEEFSDLKLFAVAENLGIYQKEALNIAYEKMVRVSKNLFVADTLINFDVAGVDEALAPFVQNKIIPLRSVTSFTGFPYVAGCTWNLFLLESFLRKYSRRYTYAASAANSSNIGAIFPKTMKFKDYHDVQAAAVAQENIPLEKSNIENFLFQQGFRAKKVPRMTERIVSRIQKFLNR